MPINPILLIQLGQLLLGGLLDVKQLVLNDSTYAPQFKAALDANLPLDAALQATLMASAVAANDAVQGA